MNYLILSIKQPLAIPGFISESALSVGSCCKDKPAINLTSTNELFWSTGGCLVLSGACSFRPRHLDIFLTARTAASLVLSGGWMCCYQGNMEGFGGCWLLQAQTEAHWSSTGHLDDQTTCFRICCKVNLPHLLSLLHKCKQALTECFQLNTALLLWPNGGKTLRNVSM